MRDRERAHALPAGASPGADCAPSDRRGRRSSAGRLGLALIAAATLALAPATAAADDGDKPFAFGGLPGWTLLGGLSGGGSFGSGGGGGFLGGELSLNRLQEGAWAGLYVDGLYDFGRSESLLSAGPQFGMAVLGVDLGGALRTRDGENDVGVVGRLMVSLGLFSLYGRYGYFIDSEDHLGQIGLLLKWPLWASSGVGK